MHRAVNLYRAAARLLNGNKRHCRPLNVRPYICTYFDRLRYISRKRLRREKRRRSGSGFTRTIILYQMRYVMFYNPPQYARSETRFRLDRIFFAENVTCRALVSISATPGLSWKWFYRVVTKRLYLLCRALYIQSKHTYSLERKRSFCLLYGRPPSTRSFSG
jgi:hypothetical protein